MATVRLPDVSDTRTVCAWPFDPVSTLFTWPTEVPCESFTVADLTAAALFYGVARPPEFPYPMVADVQKLDLDYGRFYSDKDLEQRNHVAVIGSEAKTKLYSGLYPIGQRIRIKDVSFTVIGVLRAKMQEGDDNINRVIYIPFSTMSDVKDTKYLDGIWFNYHGNYLTTESALRGALGAAHGFPASDHNAIYVANLMQQLSQFHVITTALQVLMAFIGTLTLGIAGIGLMNIMLVAVQQRTREIGIEKALGACRRHILLQFLSEALVITGVGGVCGIALAYLVSLVVGSITLYSAIAKNGEAADIHHRSSDGGFLWIGDEPDNGPEFKLCARATGEQQTTEYCAKHSKRPPNGFV